MPTNRRWRLSVDQLFCSAVAVPPNKLTAGQLGRLIYEIRGQRVMLDSDLATIYGVEAKALNRAVKRNRDRFPKDFVFQLTRQESEALRYQFGTLKTGRGEHRKYRPWVFTEHGAIMAANVLNSPRAVQMSVFVVRAFLKMRALLGDKRELAKKLAALERELTQRLHVLEIGRDSLLFKKLLVVIVGQNREPIGRVLLHASDRPPPAPGRTRSRSDR